MLGKNLVGEADMTPCTACDLNKFRMCCQDIRPWPAAYRKCTKPIPLTDQQWMDYRGGGACGHDSDVIWILSPLGRPVALAWASVDHALSSSPNRQTMALANIDDASQEIAAESLIASGKIALYIDFITCHPVSLEHILSLMPFRRHSAVHQAQDLARVVASSVAARAVIEDLS